jgi:hypothetical protein
MEFSRIHSKKPACLICFFEGKNDVVYYGIRIRENLKGMDYEPINCGGKQKVLGLFARLQGHSHLPYRQANTAFFVDRDFDPPLSADLREAVYETPGYAIENFYTSLDCFKRILKEVFKISEFEEDTQTLFAQCIRLFMETQPQFHIAIAPLNVWMKLIRSLPDCQTQKKLSWSKIEEKLKDWIPVKLGEVTTDYNIQDLNKLYGLTATIISEQEVATEQEKSFPIPHRGKLFRGKFELYFFIEFLTQLLTDLNASSPTYFPKRRKVSFSIEKDNDIFLSKFSSSADTPSDLREYLSHRVKG